MISLKLSHTLWATLIAGLMIGAVLTTALRAQGTPPAYVVAEWLFKMLMRLRGTTLRKLREPSNAMVAEFSPPAS